MVLDPTKLSLEMHEQISQLQGEVHGLKSMLAILIAHVALLNHAPAAKREEILQSLYSMLPGALAKIEHDAPPQIAAGFERAVEDVAHIARSAVRFEPVMPSQPEPPGAAR